MPRRTSRLNLQPERLKRAFKDELKLNSSLQFVADISKLIWQYKWYSLAIFIITIFQEYAGLWPVSLLGQFIDRLETGDLGNVVWLFFGASILYPLLVRANVMLRHKMFYETDFQKLVELVLKVSDQGKYSESEAAGAAFSRAANAVSGITNATYHTLGSFTPVIIKIIIVSGSLLAYNRLLGVAYVTSLIVPAFLTFLFNKWLRVLLDSQYSVVSDLNGVAIKAISEKENQSIRARFMEIMRNRKRIFLLLIYKNQFYLYVREATLVVSQFLVVFLALGMRQQLHMTPGDFAKIIGYMGQVAAAFINAAACLDAIVSYSRAYHIYAITGQEQSGAISKPEEKTNAEEQ